MRGATQKKVPDYSTVDQKSVSLQQEVLHFLEPRKKVFCHPFRGRGKELVGGGQGKQKRYNFTAEHARLVRWCEQGRISHLR